jgi:hypothetical protein
MVRILKDYNISQVTGDAAGWALSEFARHRIPYFPAKTKSELYLNVLPMLVSGRLRLLDNAKLRRQFSALERTVRAGGAERIEEPLRSGSHDDLANVVAGAAVVMAEILSRNPAAVVSDYIGAFTAARSGFPGSNYLGSTPEDAAYLAAHGGKWPRGGNGNSGSLVW